MRSPPSKATVRARQKRGADGEARVTRWLERQGYQILARNVRVGRLEIDVIAIRNRLIVFCEVRTRRREAIVAAVETITDVKIARLRRAALIWLADHPIDHEGIRFDVAAVEVDGTKMKLDYYEDAF